MFDFKINNLEKINLNIYVNFVIIQLYYMGLINVQIKLKKFKFKMKC